MIEIKDLAASYDGKKILSFPNWHLEKGAHCLMLGPSGSGKTTLLHMLGGLLRPYKGHVIIDGHDLTSLRKDGLDKFRGQNIGLVFQKPHLIQSLNVKENLLAAQFFAGLDQDNHRINEVLDELNMGHKIHAPVYSLSQGEAQRVSIARAMLNKPKVILADEPTSSLDDDNCTAVINLLEEQAAKCGAALVISTHDQRLKDRVSTHLVLATHV